MNSTIRLPVGDRYEVIYENSTMWAKVHANQETVLSLSKLIVPKTNLQIRVFNDLTAADQKELLIQRYWGNSDGRLFYSIIYAYPQYKSIRDAHKAGPVPFFNAGVEIYNDASCAYLTVYADEKKEGAFESTNRLFNSNWFSSPSTATFVSVFPGTYGVSFYDQSIQHGTYELGIQVK